MSQQFANREESIQTGIDEGVLVDAPKPTTPPTSATMETSKEVDQIFAALAMAQGVIEQPYKTKTAKVKGQTKGGKDYEYTYKYCDIADVLEAMKKPYSDNGIAILQFPRQEIATIQVSGGETRTDLRVYIKTVLGHKSGQWVSNEIWAHAESGDAQDIGIVCTYLRRYGAQMLGGIAADEDKDGNKDDHQAPGIGGPQPQRAGKDGEEFEVLAPITEIEIRKTKDQKDKYGFKVNIAPGWASTLDRKLYEDLRKEKDTGLRFFLKLRRAGAFLDLIGAEAELARKATRP